MARLARIVAPGIPHHIIQRGNNRQDVFFVDDDRRVYLALLKEQCEKHGLTVISYCLMTNHSHIVGVPEHERSLANAIGRTHFQYAQYVNRMHGRSGHLWQNRFDSCVLDPAHLINTLLYVHHDFLDSFIVLRRLAALIEEVEIAGRMIWNSNEPCDRMFLHVLASAEGIVLVKPFHQ